MWQKLAQSFLNGITQPVDIEAEGQISTMDRQVAEKIRLAKIMTTGR